MSVQLTLRREDWPIHLDSGISALLEQAERLISPNRATPPTELDVEIAWSSVRSAMSLRSLIHFVHDEIGVPPCGFYHGVTRVTPCENLLLSQFELCLKAREIAASLGIETIEQLKASTPSQLMEAAGEWDAAGRELVQLHAAKFATVSVRELEQAEPVPNRDSHPATAK